MIPSQCIHHVPHTQHNEPIQWYLTQRTQMRHRHENQQESMGIGPGDQSEEAHPSMMIDGCQNKIVWRVKAVRCLTSYTEGLDPMEQVTRRHHHGNKNEPPYKRLTTLLGISTCIHHTTSSPASLFIFSFP